MKTIFFDLDGTLTDPKDGITRSIAYALRKVGVEAPPIEDLTWCIGPPLAESLKILISDVVRAGEALKHYRERFAESGMYENALYPGIDAGLASLSSLGARLYVATSKPWVFAEEILSHFKIRDYFDAVYGAELDGVRSNKSDLLRYALDKTGAKPERALMIGDRRHDVDGALKNGVTAIGVSYGYGSREELVEAGANTVLASPEELFVWLKEEVYG